MKKKHKSQVLMLLLILLGTLGFAQCPSGALTFTSSTTTIAAGQVYCVSSNGITTTNLSIQAGGKLIIQNGISLNATGVLTMVGDLEIQNNAGLRMTGSMSIGTNGQPINTLVKLGDRSFLSITGALTQFDPTQGGVLNPGSKAQIEIGSQSIVEVCATFSQNSSTYPSVEYTGDPSSYVYFVVQAPAVGTGASVLSNDSQIRWIEMDQAVFLSPGNATYCGPFASQSTCAVWPDGLSVGGCNYAEGIIDNFPSSVCVKPATAGTPNGFTKLGITIHATKQTNWPENIPNGFIAMESNTRGFVITRVQNSSLITDAREGMMIYDIDSKCVKINNGTDWKCIEKSCND